MIPCSVIVDRVSLILLDEHQVQWPESEHVDVLNTGITAICGVKPSAHVENIGHTLVAGALQEVNDAVQVLDVTQNMGADGGTPGRSIRQISRSDLDDMDPDWMTDTGPQVEFFTLDERAPKLFHVYPHPGPGHQVRVLAATAPERIESVSDTFPLDSIYETPMAYFAMHFLLSKQSRRGDIVKSEYYHRLFMAALAGKSAARTAFAPHAEKTPPSER